MNETAIHSPDQSVSVDRGSSNVTVNLGGVTLLVVVILVAIIGACGVVMGLNLAKQDQMDRDYRDASTRLMLNERRLMDREAYDILSGNKYFSDDTHGPTGNLQRMIPKGDDHGRR